MMQVVIAEDHYLVREGTRQLLESSGEVQVVAAVENSEALLDAVERLVPDAVVVDIRMPPTHQTEGIDAAHAIRQQHPDIGIVVLSQYANSLYAFELFREGTSGVAYLLKDRVGDLDELLRALREVTRRLSAGQPHRPRDGRPRRDGPGKIQRRRCRIAVHLAERGRETHQFDLRQARFESRRVGHTP
jgi:DNA-binding NarL/FixJ family response regulator